MALEILNLAEFNAELKAAMKSVEGGARKVLVKTSTDGFSDLQEQTPKETRRAAGGWNVTVDSKPKEWKPEKGKKYYPLQPFTGEGRIKHDSIVNLSNNVEYIIPLDEAHSKQQAPNGIIFPVFSKIQVNLKSLIRRENQRKIK